MRYGSSHYLVTNCTIYGLPNVIKQIIFVHYPQNITTQLTLLIILASLHCKSQIHKQTIVCLEAAYLVETENFLLKIL